MGKDDLKANRDIFALLQTITLEKSFWKLRLLDAWKSIAGGMSDKIIIHKIERSTLFLGAIHPLWAQEASFYVEELKMRINMVLGQERITKIVVSGSLPERYLTQESRQRALNPATLEKHKQSNEQATLTEKEQEVLKVIVDPKLSQRLALFYQQCKRRSTLLRGLK